MKPIRKFGMGYKPDDEHPCVVVVPIHRWSLQAGFLVSGTGEVEGKDGSRLEAREDIQLDYPHAFTPYCFVSMRFVHMSISEEYESALELCATML